jgi:hypothetical protein
MATTVMAFWLNTCTIIGSLASIIALFVLFPSVRDWHWQLKWGLALGSAGLLVQVVRTLFFAQHGHYPQDEWFPLWICKDLGISMLIYYFTFTHDKQQKQA